MKRSMLWLTLALMTSVVLPQAAQADCGIRVLTKRSWYYCERDDDVVAMTYPVPCANGDALVLTATLKPSCWFETGFVTATAYEPKWGYDMDVAARPPFVQFVALKKKRVEVRLENIWLWMPPGEPAEVVEVPVQVTPVSAHGAVILNDWINMVPWQAEALSPPVEPPLPTKG